MTQKNRETMERAIGICEGLAWISEEKMSNALITIVEMLESVLREEGADDGR